MASRLRSQLTNSSDTPGPAVIVENLRREFDGRVVLDGINLTIQPGDFVSLLGRSGSGKSTFLRILADFDRGSEGVVRVPARRAVAFQDARLLPWKRVLANITLGLSKEDAAQLGSVALQEVGLDGHERAWPSTLSGGEAQRASLARSLVRKPELLLLDEPFGALDALTRLKMQELLQQVYRRHRPAVLLVTHDVDEAIHLSDRVLVLDHGTITFDEIITATSSRSRSDGSFVALRDALLAELGVSQNSDQEYRQFDEVSRRPIAVPSIS